jgi:homoserine O-acetyltransferase
MRRSLRFVPLLLASLLFASPVRAQAPAGADFVLNNFVFSTGDTMPALRIHYITFGTPRRDASGTVRNAVMILHGTTGSGSAFTSRTYAGELFGPGELLDTAKYFVVLPDGIGHGKSSKPSDGLRMKFPKYTYDDMVDAQHRLLVEGLKVNHLRLVMGTSMGCMHAWIWGERYPDFVDGLVPLACAPTQIAGRNRMMRKMIIDDIESDPEWNGGNYTTQPRGLRAGMGLLFVLTSAPLVQQKSAPTRDAADKQIMAYLDRQVKAQDANDVIYAFDASRDYDPSAHLEDIKAHVLAINSADDFVNPPELPLMNQLMPRVKHGRFVMIPISDATRGHGTHSLPAVWKSYLGEFLATLPPTP